MSRPVDLVLKKAFAEQQLMTQKTNEALKIADCEIAALKRTILQTQLTNQEMSSMGPDTKTYESVGRMFMLKDMAEIRTNLQKKADDCNQKIKTVENKKDFLKKCLKDSEDNLREMVQQRRDMASTSH